MDITDSVIVIKPYKITKIILIIFLFFFAFHIIGEIIYFTLGEKLFYNFINAFNFDKEGNITNFYSSVLLLSSAIILFLISSLHKKIGEKYFLWLLLGIIFIYLSVDESIAIHERLIKPIRGYLNTKGIFLYAWVIPYGIGVILVILFYTKFIKELPVSIRKRIVIAGVLYIVGAMGFEMIAGFFLSNGINKNEILIHLTYTIEESLEFIGIIIFIDALMRYIATQFPQLSFSISGE